MQLSDGYSSDISDNCSEACIEASSTSVSKKGFGFANLSPYMR